MTDSGNGEQQLDLRVRVLCCRLGGGRFLAQHYGLYLERRWPENLTTVS